MIDGKHLYVAEAIILEAANGEHIFPIGRLRDMAFLAAVGARVEKVGGSRAQVQIETLVGIGREKAHGFILEDKIADAIENRLAFIDLDSHGKMRAVADKDVGAFVTLETAPLKYGRNAARTASR